MKANRFHSKRVLLIVLIIILIPTLLALFEKVDFSLQKSLNNSSVLSQAQEKKENMPEAANGSETIAKSVDSSNDNIQNNQNNKDTKLADLKLPVIMYHHIRDFNDPSDKVGTNLSVAPEDFAKQLDFIKDKGYETITFQDIDDDKIPAKPVILTFDDGYQNFYQNAYPELKKRNMKAVAYIITGYIGKNEYMNLVQIKEISEYGIEIGGHTISHPDLTKSPIDKIHKEVNESKTTLEGIIGEKVISFCYPSGKFNAEIEKEISDAGYKYATTTVGGITTFQNLFELNRYRANNDTNVTKYFK